MITDKEFLATELSMGIGFGNPEFKALAEMTANEIRGMGFSLLDYGAGTGVYADAFYRSGYDVFIYEHFEAHREYIKENAPHLKIIEKPINTDVMAFIEVAEHMTDKELNDLFKAINPEIILFSSTSERKPGWDEMWGHINVKDQADWDSFFAKKGYSVYKQLSVPSPWAKIYKK